MRRGDFPRSRRSGGFYFVVDHPRSPAAHGSRRPSTSRPPFLVQLPPPPPPLPPFAARGEHRRPSAHLLPTAAGPTLPNLSGCRRAQPSPPPPPPLPAASGDLAVVPSALLPPTAAGSALPNLSGHRLPAGHRPRRRPSPPAVLRRLSSVRRPQPPPALPPPPAALLLQPELLPNPVRRSAPPLPFRIVPPPPLPHRPSPIRAAPPSHLRLHKFFAGLGHRNYRELNPPPEIGLNWIGFNSEEQLGTGNGGGRGTGARGTRRRKRPESTTPRGKGQIRAAAAAAFSDHPQLLMFWALPAHGKFRRQAG